ncbi:response regulator [Vibrio gigantis]|uniref:Sensory/regulatory protein RpfC n=1 Tax=Vibrio gigantis TaxID=296199 RepID=A0A5M9N9H4_9VIBR|nr:response regulator [Vibrio gigantis]KAA8667104.1 response regulator [Vibrio gigantis]
MTFRTKTIIGIASIEIVMLMALVISAMSFLSDSNEQQLIKRAQATSQLFARATKDAVLSTDIATLDDIVKEIMTIEDIVYVKVERNEVLLSSAGATDYFNKEIQVDTNLSNVDDGIFDTYYPIESDGLKYGSISIGFTTSSINSMLTDAKKTISSIALIEVILVAFCSFILGTYLTKHLYQLSFAVKKVRTQGPGFQLKIKSDDELGDVVNAFNDMSTSLSKNYTDIKQAREQAEQASESKSRFLASMSHEIRTPMNGVLGILSLLKETKLTKDQSHLVNTASTSGELLLSIINDILDFSRMEANTLILEQKTFSLQECIHSTIDSFEPSANAKNIQLVTPYQPDQPVMVVGDVHRFQQILLNLIGNAIKFTSEGSVIVNVETNETEDNKVEITCQVADSGIGIESNAMSYLFEEFTMVDQGYSRRRDGSGLGLAICKHLAKLMDGNISASSEEGVGSTFTFSVMLEKASNSGEDSRSGSSSVALNPKILSSRILVAEDNKANQLVIVNMFKNAGMTIDIANDGNQAVEMVKNNDYDFIFMDISMPEKDGLQACSEIRNLPNTQKASVPIVALTAHALAGDREQFLNQGMDDYLAKPMRMSQIADMLHLHLVTKQEHAIEQKPHTVKTTQSCEPTTSVIQARDTRDESEAIENISAMGDKVNQIANQPMVEIQVPADLVDEQILEQMVEDTCAEVMPMLIEHYIVESESRIKLIQKAVQEQDVSNLEFETHTLGSSSLALGNRRLSVLARKVEKLCSDKQSELAFSKVDELVALAKESMSAIEKRKERGFN